MTCEEAHLNAKPLGLLEISRTSRRVFHVVQLILRDRKFLDFCMAPEEGNKRNRALTSSPRFDSEYDYHEGNSQVRKLGCWINRGGYYG